MIDRRASAYLRRVTVCLGIVVAWNAPAPAPATAGAAGAAHHEADVAATQPAGMAPVGKWTGVPERRWAGPDIWTNRLQDWVVRDEALVCEPAGANTPCRTAHVLTYQLADKPGPFRMQVVLRAPRDGWRGLLAARVPLDGDRTAGQASRGTRDEDTVRQASRGTQHARNNPGVAAATHPATTRPGREDVTAPPPARPRDSATIAFAGFLIGAGEGRLDYRAAALVHHSPGKGGGMLAVFEPASGALTFRDMSRPETRVEFPALPGQKVVTPPRAPAPGARLLLTLEGLPKADDKYDLRLSLLDVETGRPLGEQELSGVSAARLFGNVALAANPGAAGTVFAFEDLRVGGERFAHDPEHAFGPIAGTLYCVANRTLKLGVQFAHLGEAVIIKDPDATELPRLRAVLQVRPAIEGGVGEGEWRTIGPPQAISPPDYYVLFRVEGWDPGRDWLTRIVFDDADGQTYTYETFIRRNPVDKPVLSAAGFTGMGLMGRTAYQAGPEPAEGEVLVGRWTPANVWMPFAEAVRAVGQHDVDILFFTGDQIYEGKPSPKDFSREPIDDFLYKWLAWHWSFRELTRRMPAIVQTDDHDVYHGNIWGWSGRGNLTGNNRDGGYLCSPTFVNLVQRVYAGHHPDAYDPGPAPTGILHYYSAFTWGHVGLAVLEDRKFKTPPDVTEPAEQSLLGERQMRFLNDWAQDWTGQLVKVAVSQTVYASMHVDEAGRLVADKDSNGFPKVRRDEALDALRRCGALILCGDQHLGTFARLGIQKPGDAVYQFCVPALGNIFWRWFYPAEPGGDRAEAEPDYLGAFQDPFGNWFRMIAVANPQRRDLLAQKLRQRNLIPRAEAAGGMGDAVRTSLGDGYGIVRIDKQARTITVECWPHGADPAGGDKQFAGWPVTVKWDALDGRQPVAWLPDLRIATQPDAIVRIVDQATGRIVKVTRAHGGFYRPGVFDKSALYALQVGDPAAGAPWWTAANLKPSQGPGEQTLDVQRPGVSAGGGFTLEGGIK